MATSVVLLDDLALAEDPEATVRAARTCSLVFDGLAVEIDLSQDHIEDLHKHLAPYIEAGRKVKLARPAVAGLAAVRARNGRIEQWATATGHKVTIGANGKRYISIKTRTAYLKAHPEDPPPGGVTHGRAGPY
jgi:hypothetical protein